MFDVPLNVFSLMRDFKPNWFVAGGWAVDLFIGKETRLHEDVEIAVFRSEQIILQDYLDGWVLKKAVNKRLLIWKRGEHLKLPVHAIHCFNETVEPHFLEVLLNEKENGNWLYRRNTKVKMPLSDLYLTSESGIKFLRPEIVLLYKSKNPRLKDEQDFEAVVEYLDTKSKKWLKNALAVCYLKHHWEKRL